MVVLAIRVFSLPAGLLARGGESPPWASPQVRASEGLDALARPASGLVLCRLAAVTLRTQRAEPVPSVRIGDTSGDQRAARLRVVVDGGRLLRAQETPGVGVQVGTANPGPAPGVVPALCCCPSLLLCLALVLRAASARGQLGAPGDRARGTGLSRHSGWPPFHMTYLRRLAAESSTRLPSTHERATERPSAIRTPLGRAALDHPTHAARFPHPSMGPQHGDVGQQRCRPVAHPTLTAASSTSAHAARCWSSTCRRCSRVGRRASAEAVSNFPLTVKERPDIPSGVTG